jgi:biotin carboxyl carrier protein
MHTTLIDDWAAQGEPLLQRPQPDTTPWLLAAAAHAWPANVANRATTTTATTASTAELRPPALARWQLTLACQGETRLFTVQNEGDAVLVTQGGTGHRVRWLSQGEHWRRVEFDGIQRTLVCHQAGAAWHLAWQAASFVFTEPSPFPSQHTAVDARRVCAPVAGTVAQVAVQPGDIVSEGQPLVCVEAMKMEMWQHAAAAGTVAAVHVATRDSVAAGSLLVELTLHPPHPEKADA